MYHYLDYGSFLVMLRMRNAYSYLQTHALEAHRFQFGPVHFDHGVKLLSDAVVMTIENTLFKSRDYGRIGCKKELQIHYSRQLDAIKARENN